jgi:hypothetical protein
MAQDQVHYEQLIERALRGVVRDVLLRAARGGLPGTHHFFIGFASREPGVEIPAHLLEKFPEEMTIVIQHQFWDLQVEDQTFSVTLSFNRQPERLTVPFAAIRSFADPSVNFALEFAAPAAAPENAATPAGAASLPAPAAEAQKAEPPGGEVVRLDSFRKR